MYKDEDLIWEGDFPYDVLAEAGITPESTLQEILDALPYFKKQKRSAEVKPAWEQLRLVRSRLFMDFFLYHYEPDSQIDEEHAGE